MFFIIVMSLFLFRVGLFAVFTSICADTVCSGLAKYCL